MSDKVQAIQDYMREHDVGLAEAKRAIDAVARPRSHAHTPQPTSDFTQIMAMLDEILEAVRRLA